MRSARIVRAFLRACSIASVGITLGLLSVASLQAQAPAAPNEVMTNRDIIALVKANVPAEVILAKIATSKGSFDVSTNGLIELNQAQVPSAIVKAMMERPASNAMPVAAPARRPTTVTVPTVRSALPLDSASNPHERRGFWFDLGIGLGSLGCSDCVGTVSGVSGQWALGGAINQKFLLGVGTNGWYKSEGGVNLSLTSIGVLARFYPSAAGGFHLEGGLGYAYGKIGVIDYGAASTSGTSAVLGLGWDMRIAKDWSLTPYFDGVGASFGGVGVNFGQYGIRVTTH